MVANETSGLAQRIAVTHSLKELDYTAAKPYRVSVDVWINFDVTLQPGSATEFAGAAVGHDRSTPGISGASLIFSGDGGSAADYRLYIDQTVLEIESGHYNRDWQSNNSSDPSLRAAFPGIFVDLATQYQQGATDTVTPAGSGGFQWMTLMIDVDPLARGDGPFDHLGSAKFTLTSVASGSTLVIGEIDGSQFSTPIDFESGFALIYSDLFASLNQSGFNFGIFDNLVVGEAVPEPSTLVLLVAAAGLTACRRQTKNRLATSLIFTAAAVSLFADNAAAQTGDLPGWRLVWQDEFDTAGVDTSKWQVLTRQNSYNEEKQYYLPQQASIVEGHLRITATNQPIANKQYRSARLESWQAFGPGRFEARIDLPTGQGMWPAFWLFPNDRSIPWPTGGEIDILENRGSQPELVGSAYHWQASPGPCCDDAHYVSDEHIALDEFGLVNFHEGFHVYAAEWEKDEIRFYVDDELSFTVRETPSRPVFETPKNIILNLAVGGLFGGDPDLTTVFPQVMDVDYVRVWEAVPEPSGWMLLVVCSMAMTYHYRDQPNCRGHE